MINLETPARMRAYVNQAHQVAAEFLRPSSRRYDLAEHEYPKELDMLASMVDGMHESGTSQGAGATGVRRSASTDTAVRNGTHMSSVLSIMEMCWGDVGLLLSMPRQGLGNSAIASVASDEQLERFAGVWAAMAITEPGCGSDSAAIRTTAVRSGDEYVINGEKIYVTAGGRCDAVVVWATLDFAGVMRTFDNTRPLVAAMAVGCARAALELTRELLEEAGVRIDYDRPLLGQSAAAATYLLTMQAAWMADNRRPNSLAASMAKAKAGRVGNDITLRCVELAGSVGYSEHELLEKWARDSTIFDIFEGTQQIQRLIVARRLLGLASAELSERKVNTT
jgi:acyl-CoA dehydrogenase